MRCMIKCSIAALVVLLTLSSPLRAQAATGSDKDSSKVSVFGGYSFLHYSNGIDTALYGVGEPNLTANSNGFVVSAAYNFTNMFAVVGEYGFYHASSLSGIGVLPAGETITANMQTYLFGPKVSFMSKSPVKPFAQVLIGGVSGTDKNSYAGNSLTGPTANGLAVAVGGGLDCKVNRHLSIRPAQFEYLMTRFTNSNTLTETGEDRLGDGGNNMQNNYRYSAGVVYNF